MRFVQQLADRRISTRAFVAIGCLTLLMAGAIYWTLSQRPATRLPAGVIFTTRPAHSAANLQHWPFGAGEQAYAAGDMLDRRIAFLQGEVAKGFPIPADWQPQLNAAQAAGRRDLITIVNLLVNTKPFHADRRDEWRTPKQFLLEGGDCDCFVAAKYVLLRSLGLPAADLRVTIVGRRQDSDLHAILVVRDGAGKFDRLILDNLNDELRTALYADAYVPLLSLNEAGAWLHHKHGEIVAKTLGR